MSMILLFYSNRSVAQVEVGSCFRVLVSHKFPSYLSLAAYYYSLLTLVRLSGVLSSALGLLSSNCGCELSEEIPYNEPGQVIAVI